MNIIYVNDVKSFLLKDGTIIENWKDLVEKQIDGENYLHYDQIDEKIKDKISKILLKDNIKCSYITFDIPELPIEQIKCTYSGKPGCMCGCKGIYYYTHSAESTIPSYYKDEDRSKQINNSVVKRMYNSMKKLSKVFGVEVIEGERRTIGESDIYNIDHGKYEEDIRKYRGYGRRKTLYLL